MSSDRAPGASDGNLDDLDELDELDEDFDDLDDVADDLDDLDDVADDLDGVADDLAGAERSADFAAQAAAVEAELAETRARLAEVPAQVVIVNHAMGLYELAAIHLSAQPARLEQAALSIDAFGALVEGLADRLGEEEPTLRDALSQIRLAFVQIKRANS